MRLWDCFYFEGLKNENKIFHAALTFRLTRRAQAARRRPGRAQLAHLAHSWRTGITGPPLQAVMDGLVDVALVLRRQR